MVEKKQSRSEITKANILKAARERFAADGYERTTIRAVAGDAGIDPALVMRYFANKEGLFAAAADFQLGLPSFDGIARSRIGRALVAHFLDRWEGDDNLKALLRAAATNPDAAKRLQQLFARQLLPAVGRLCTDQESAATRAGLVGSQALGLALTRYILKLPPVVGMSREELIDWIGPTLQRYLTASG